MKHPQIRPIILPALIFILALPGLSQLRVSDNKRFLITADGKPFFWLGDTAWELFHRLTREEATIYLQTRASQKFTVIQAVALAEMDGLQTPNAYGEIPLENNDPARPREAYFKHVDFIIDKANELGLYIALLPTWGDKVFKNTWGVGPEIFNTENARTFGQWIGNRYKNRKNVIWVLGGDRNPRNESDVAIWRSMAEGIVAGAGGRNNALMTFHPQPNDVSDGGSAKWFHNDEWLDFNMFQTGHCRENNVWDRIQAAYNKTPTKPALDGETLYEDHPVCFNAKDLGTSSAFDVRKHAYLDMFAGAFGHTYGCHDIWQFYTPERTPVNGPHFPWYIAVNLPGATQMQHLRALIESRPILERVPDQSIITNARGTNDRVQATRGADYIFVYSAEGMPFSVNVAKISGKQWNTAWYNPRTGESRVSEMIAGKSRVDFTPPTNGYGQDWVLIIDDASKQYKLPPR